MQTFEQRLSKELLRMTSIVALAMLVLFSSVLLGVNYFNYRMTVTTNNTKMDQFVEELNNDNGEMINRIEEVVLKQEELETIDRNRMMEEFYALNSKSIVPSSLIILDSNNEIILTTFANYQINDHMKLFIDFFIDSLDEKIGYRSYAYSKDLTYLLSGRKVTNDDNNTIILIQTNDRLNEELIKDGISGVVTDKYNRVIASSNIIFNTSKDNKFYLRDGIFNEDTYDSSIISFNNVDMTGVTLTKANSLTTTIVLGIIMLFIFYFIVIFIFKKSIGQIAKKQLKSFNTLMDEINIVTKEDISHKLITESNDEFEMIAHEINQMNDTIRLLTENNTELKFRSKVSELKRLEAQFNPHFLYNTLDAIRHSSTIDPEITSDIIIRLTKILRYSINNEETSIPLHSDMEYIKLYCELQKYRFNDNFNYEINIEEECLDVDVPKLFLQPLIENSIKNSFIHKTTSNIAINIFMRTHYMVIEVEDDGIGIEPIKLEEIMNSLGDDKQLENHHGLYNTYRRIKILYGDRCTIHIESEHYKGTKVYLILDLSRKAEHINV